MAQAKSPITKPMRSKRVYGAWNRCFENARFLAEAAAKRGDILFQDTVWRLIRFVTLIKFLDSEFRKQEEVAPGRVDGPKGIAQRNKLSRHGVYKRIESAGLTLKQLEDPERSIDKLLKDNSKLVEIVQDLDSFCKQEGIKLPHRWPVPSGK